MMLVTASMLGGVLPDIDLQQSTPSRLLFTAFGLIVSISWVFSHVSEYSAVSLWIAGLVLFALVRWPAAWLFGTLTVHRGALHSLLAAGTAMLCTTALAYRFGNASSQLAWFLGAFMALGYIVHLVLDELWSVDFTGARIKRTFGTAIKPVDIKRWPGSAALLISAFFASMALPPVTPLREAASLLATAISTGSSGLILPLPLQP